MVVLRSSDCPRCGCVEDLEMGRRNACRICIPRSCRDFADP